LVARRNRMVAQRNRMLARRNRLVGHRNRMVARRNRLVAHRNRMVARRNRLVARRNRMVVRRNRLVARRTCIPGYREAIRNHHGAGNRSKTRSIKPAGTPPAMRIMVKIGLTLPAYNTCACLHRGKST
jgi:hypothetical protein